MTTARAAYHAHRSKRFGLLVRSSPEAIGARFLSYERHTSNLSGQDSEFLRGGSLEVGYRAEGGTGEERSCAVENNA